jgi:glycosidase
MAMLFTLRGMPCIYYGTEILMKGKTAESDAYVRFDFPGGWKSDSENKFKKSSRTAQEEEAFNNIRTLALFRQKNPVFLNGKTMQFAGKDHSYAYVRYTENQAVLCVYNQKNEANAFDMERIKERTKGYSAMRNIFTNERINIDGKPLLLPANGSEVYELIK